MSLHTYTLLSVIVILGFIAINLFVYRLPLVANLGLIYSAIVCLRAL